MAGSLGLTLLSHAKPGCEHNEFGRKPEKLDRQAGGLGGTSLQSTSIEPAYRNDMRSGPFFTREPFFSSLNLIVVQLGDTSIRVRWLLRSEPRSRRRGDDLRGDLGALDHL
jgi:hypothetical protein